MILSLVLLAAFQQQPAAQTAPTAPPPPPKPALAPSPIATLQVTPGTKVTHDRRRHPAPPGGRPRRGREAGRRRAPTGTWRQGGRFEGKVDSTGLIESGSTGALGVSVIASVPGTKPVVEKVDVRMLPGPAARVDRGSRPSAAWWSGQRLRLTATSYSAASDQRQRQVHLAQLGAGRGEGGR